MPLLPVSLSFFIRFLTAIWRLSANTSSDLFGPGVQAGSCGGGDVTTISTLTCVLSAAALLNVIFKPSL